MKSKIKYLSIFLGYCISSLLLYFLKVVYCLIMEIINNSDMLYEEIKSHYDKLIIKLKGSNE